MKKMSNIDVIGVPEEEVKENRQKQYIREITENFPNLM